MNAYRLLFHGVLRHLEPELAHRLALPLIRAAGLRGSPLRQYCAADPRLRVHALGREFASPFGMAAGFDKHANAMLGLGALGFGHVEVGTITNDAQPGNAKPRMVRLIEDRALINRMGFNNDGAAAVVPRLVRARAASCRPVIGVNIGKSRRVETVAAIADYVASTELLAPLADYLVVNVSSPNTPGLRSLQQLSPLHDLLVAVCRSAAATPVLVKIAPDMRDEQVEEIVALARRIGLAGIIATNTTVTRSGLRSDPALVRAAGAGGVSGAPLAQRALAVLRCIRRVAPEPEFCVISAGGVVTAQQVHERLTMGATLVQGFTAFIYEGPLWARTINRGLLAAGYRGNATR